MQAGHNQGRTRMGGGWVALMGCVRCMQWLCCVFGVDTGLKFREVASRGPLSVLLSMATHAHHAQHFWRDALEYKVISHLVFETVDCVLLLGGWQVMLRGCDACCAVSAAGLRRMLRAVHALSGVCFLEPK